MNTHELSQQAQRAYVTAMMDIIGRGLVSANRVDPELQREIAQFPTHFIIQMKVFPNGPSFAIQVNEDHSLTLLKDFDGKPDLGVIFKHLSHAFLVFSFQEGTARAFANDRLIADGDVSHAIRLVRCLNRMEAPILPSPVARLAVKRYPELPLQEKALKAAQIYTRVAKHFVTGN